MENGRFQIARRAWHEQSTSWERRCASGIVDVPDELLGWAGAPRLSSLELEERFGDGRYRERVNRLDAVLKDPAFEEQESIHREVLDVVRWARGRAIYTSMWKRGVSDNREALEAKRRSDRALHAKRTKLVELLSEAPALLDDPLACATALRLASEMVNVYPELVLDGVQWHGAPLVKLEATGDPLNPIVKKARQQLLDLDLNGENPAKGGKGKKATKSGLLKYLDEPGGRLRFLEPEEEARLLASAGEPLRTIILTGTRAGLRVRAEALSLKWGSVDLARRTLTVEAAYAKSKCTRTVPMSGALFEAFSSLKERSMKTGPDDPVFVNRNGTPFISIRTAFATARRKAKLGADVTPHTLRHTFASRLALAGKGLRTIQVLGGWQQISMVERYAHLSEGHLSESVEVLDEVPNVVVKSKALA